VSGQATVVRQVGTPTPPPPPERRGGIALGLKAVEMLGFRLATLPLGFVITLITSRFLLPVGRGEFTLALLTVTLASTLLGNGNAITHEVGRKRAPVQDIVGRGLLLDITLSIVAAAVVVPFAVLRGDLGSGALMMVGLPFLLVTQTVGGALIAEGRLRLYNAVQLLDSGVIVGGLLVLVVWKDYGVPGAVAAWLAGQVVSAIVLMVGARDTWLPIPAQAISFVRSKPIFTLGAKAGLVSLVSLINYRVELFLLEFFDGLKAVGIYSVAVSLAELLWLLSWTIQTVVVDPAVNEEEDRAVSVVAQGVRHSLVLTFFSGLVLGAVGAFAVPFVFGDAFEGSVVPLLVLLPGVVIFSVRSPLSVYFSMRTGTMRYPLIVAGASAIATGLLCVPFIPLWGATGAALATTLGYGIGTALLVAMFLRVTRTSLGTMVPTARDFAAYRDLARKLLKRG